MEAKIINNTFEVCLPDILKKVLPYRLYASLENALREGGLLEEIKIRRDRQSYAVIGGRNVILPVIVKKEEIEAILSEMCGGSLYAHKETISNGYISLDGSIRVGVCGRAVLENGKILGVYDVSELSVRIPNALDVSSEKLCDMIHTLGGALIYSPPGVGKTTLLRSLIKRISFGRRALRTAVIDTRGELSYGIFGKELLVSVLLSYPIDLGIEISVRTLNPQLLVCDEIGNERDAEAIINAHGCGVPLVASCHGGSIEEILRKGGISKLHKERIFGSYVGIERDGKGGFIYDITSWEAANDSI